VASFAQSRGVVARAGVSITVLACSPRGPRCWGSGLGTSRAAPWTRSRREAPRRVSSRAPRGYTTAVDRSFEQMTTAERVLYVQALWDRIAEDSDEVPLSEAQRAEIRRRVEEHRAAPESAVPWEQVLARARAVSLPIVFRPQAEAVSSSVSMVRCDGHSCVASPMPFSTLRTSSP
jgi:putative addiction module component (TIGR02574 family)